MVLVQVALYSSDGDEAALMSYLDSARDLLGNPLYDAQAALQAARRHGLRRASVELLWQLKLYEVWLSTDEILFWLPPLILPLQGALTLL